MEQKQRKWISAPERTDNQTDTDYAVGGYDQKIKWILEKVASRGSKQSKKIILSDSGSSDVHSESCESDCQCFDSGDTLSSKAQDIKHALKELQAMKPECHAELKLTNCTKCQQLLEEQLQQMKTEKRTGEEKRKRTGEEKSLPKLHQQIQPTEDRH